jgi:hypothetical protein
MQPVNESTGEELMRSQNIPAVENWETSTQQKDAVSEYDN